MKPSPNAERQTFRIFGMDCAEEVALLRREVGQLVGGEDRLAFDILAGKMIVADPAATVTADQIVEAVRRAGLSAEPWSDDRSEHDRDRFRQFTWEWLYRYVADRPALSDSGVPAILRDRAVSLLLATALLATQARWW